MGLLRAGKGKRGPGAGDKVRPWHKGRSGRTKAGAGVAALPLPGRRWARRRQRAPEETAVQTGCGPKQRWAFPPAQRSAYAELKETAQASSSSPPDTNSLLESNRFSQQELSLEPNISSTLGQLQRVRRPPTRPSKPQQMLLHTAMCEPNSFPCHDTQQKGPDTVPGATLEGPGAGRNRMILNGQRRSFTNFHWHLFLRFPLLKTKPSHGVVSGLFTLCQSGKHKS